jgi:hypothetical protein
MSSGTITLPPPTGRHAFFVVVGLLGSRPFGGSSTNSAAIPLSTPRVQRAQSQPR